MAPLIQDATTVNQKDLKPQRDGDWPQEEKRHEELQDLYRLQILFLSVFFCRKSGRTDHVQESQDISGPVAGCCRKCHPYTNFKQGRYLSVLYLNFPKQ